MAKRNSPIRIGTRGSDLALWQARWVEHTLRERHPGLTTTVEIIKTTGDRILDTSLSRIGDKGLFTREIEHALLEGRIDLAVHSLKDLPTHLPEGCALGAVTRREDVRDVFVPHPRNPLRTLNAQPPGAVIATGSLRRRCQLLHLRPDFATAEIRGNLNTRMKRLESSSWAGMLLARAGIVRLGWDSIIGETLDPEVFLPAVGQGALGIEIRAGDERIGKIVAHLEHAPTRQETTAERALLRRLEGGCQIPIGTYAQIHQRDPDPLLSLKAMVGSLDGKQCVRGGVEGDPSEAEALGERLAGALLDAGARGILDAIREAEKRG